MEHEAKLPVADLEQVRGALKTAGAVPHGRLEHHDTLFDFPDSRLAAHHAALRIRDTGAAAYVTYKGPPEVGPFKRRPEYETTIADADVLAGVFDELGLRVTLSYRKMRETWELGGCEVCLDRVPGLGTYVEIEGPDAVAINAVAVTLGLDPSTHIDESYPHLLAAHCAATGLDPTTLHELRDIP